MLHVTLQMNEFSFRTSSLVSPLLALFLFVSPRREGLRRMEKKNKWGDKWMQFIRPGINTKWELVPKSRLAFLRYRVHKNGTARHRVSGQKRRCRGIQIQGEIPVLALPFSWPATNNEGFLNAKLSHTVNLDKCFTTGTMSLDINRNVK